MSASATLNLKPSHKAITTYYKELDAYARLGVTHEMAVRDAFQSLLKVCCSQANLTFVGEWKIKRKGRSPMSVDGAMVGFDELARGYWEAKDEQDDLAKEIKRKFAVGYPKDNIIFQSPARAILYQNDHQVLDEDITRPQILVDTLKQFFEYRAPQIEQWEDAAAKFQERVPELAESVFKLVDKERKSNNKKFIAAFAEFSALCRASINPNLSEKAIEDMLVQHLLTERIFSNVFDNPDFTRNNIIAVEIEKVIRALTSQTFSRAEFLKSSDYFYRALEETASTIEDYTQKQNFLNHVYERFFQGFSVKVADTHGIVYTPQSIVNFMVKSVEDILRKEFGRSLSDAGVHILDPFVGTGNFMIRVMQEIKRTRLQDKYTSELHCNEVMLLPYYIASMNVEHTFFDLTKTYQPFEGICLVDTFELAESNQGGLFTEENTARIERQRKQELFVIIGNPPYNVGQLSENDNNKNRKYKVIDRRVSETYAKDSQASSVSKLNDPYVKAIRWASDRIGKEGIIAFVTNNSFLDQIAHDGLRKNLEQDFDEIYILDLGGNVRKNPRLSGTTHNVFGIQIGVSLNFLIRKGSENSTRAANIHYMQVGEDWRKEQKYKFLEQSEHTGKLHWRSIIPNRNHTWLIEGEPEEYESFVPVSSKANKAGESSESTIFINYSLGANTNRDTWAYNFDPEMLFENMGGFIEAYNLEIHRWLTRTDKSASIKNGGLDKFVLNDETKIKWSSRLKECLNRGQKAIHSFNKVRDSLYRPFCKQFLYFDEILTHRRGQLPLFFPNRAIQAENLVICATGVGAERPFATFICNVIPDLNFFGPGTVPQWFPFYTYNEDGTKRRENITDWALTEFRAQYKDKSISKLNIFHYVYALLHHPTYRTTYAANLKRELPRIPCVKSLEDFRAFVRAGERLADIHINYEAQPEYPLERVEKKDAALDWRVEHMHLSKDKRSIVYNDFLMLDGIPPETFEYRLGNRSALEWIIDQYQVSTDKRSGITNDPNREDEPDYIVKLVGKVITVSLETVKIVRGLPELNAKTDSTVPEMKNDGRHAVKVSVEMNCIAQHHG